MFVFEKTTGETPRWCRKGTSHMLQVETLNEVSFSWHIRFAHRRHAAPPRGDFAFFARDQQHNPHYYWVTDSNPAAPSRSNYFVMAEEEPLSDIDLDWTSANPIRPRNYPGRERVGATVMMWHSGGDMRLYQQIDCWKTSPIPRCGWGSIRPKTYASILRRLPLPDPKRARRISAIHFRAMYIVDVYRQPRGAAGDSGQPVPPFKWSLEEFETTGQGVCGHRESKWPTRTHFYATTSISTASSNACGGEFNETMTASVANTPENIQR